MLVSAKGKSAPLLLSLPDVSFVPKSHSWMLANTQLRMEGVYTESALWSIQVNSVAVSGSQAMIVHIHQLPLEDT